ncbi:stage II sporulation protein P [Paenibacillus humicola]|uniref:stage II sporulation protein P n=1 Tax=Paenibacillus humicola TaxID=3110540 RepID=UPI00237A30BC|nr:stage II sporulation protein P [Paenibacillus humicola]
MKPVVTWNLRNGSRRLRELLVTGRTFVLLSVLSMFMVLVIGIGAIVQQNAAGTPVSSMKGLAAALSSSLFGRMLAMEMPAADDGKGGAQPSGKQLGAFLVRMLTDVNVSDPKSLLAREYPGMDGGDRTVPLTADAGTPPEDREPAGGPAAGETQGGAGGAEKEGTGVKPQADSTGGAKDGSSESPQSGGAQDGTGKPAGPAAGGQEAGHSAAPTTAGRDVVFIYHSHNRESWAPELKTNSSDPTSSTINVTLLGKRLAEELNDAGIGTLHSSTDYSSTIKNYMWVLSYKYSKKTVEEAMASNKDLKFFFDIHRDSQHRKYTTATINGKSYAQVFFIVGHANPNWRKNEAFAEEIDAALKKEYPGISRGIWGKTTATGNGEYNQSVSPDSVLIEIGGIDNTLEESYRTVDALAKVISKIYWNAEKVSVPKTNFSS